MSEHGLYLVGYDISSARRLRTALRIVKGRALGGQKSMYECWMTESEFEHVLAELSVLLNPHTDRILILRLDPRARVEALGTAAAPNNDPVLYFG